MGIDPAMSTAHAVWLNTHKIDSSDRRSAVKSRIKPWRRRSFGTVLASFLTIGNALANTPTHDPNAKGLRLYVLDCGSIHVADTERYELRRAEVDTPELSVACFLVVHPKGALVWDVGAVPDSEWEPTGQPLTHRLALPDGQSRDIALTRSLREQLAEIGYPPAKIRYIALSHYHYDHTANANVFAHSTWLVRKEERDAMFAAQAPAQPAPTPMRV